MKSRYAMRFGAALQDEARGVRFALWAPDAASVAVALRDGDDPNDRSARRHPMQALPGGWHEVTLPEARAGTRYRYVVTTAQGELAVPDPASRFNPNGVQGPSCVVDPEAYDWQDAGWRGRPWHEAVIYELHVGSFTPQGTYAAVMDKLPALRKLGITAIELMPLAEFGGARGWGYDGVLPFAPESTYGTPEDLKRLIDRAHALGLMVLLDVVDNHFGPQGNHLGAYCKAFFNPAHATPWGAAINFDAPGSATVREFYVDNALYWTEEFHFDGLRLDAVHAIRDDSARSIVAEIGAALRDGPGRARHVHLVLENEANESHLLARDEHGAPRIAEAQWNDDLHHAAHVIVTGETDGYYADYADAPLARLGRCLAEGFAYQGEPSALRGGVEHGEPSAHLPATAFVSFLQNHDQIGNRAFGERIGTLARRKDGDHDDSPARRRLEAAYACLLLSPQVPLLFMGEEWDASTPFLYFCDFAGDDPALADAVRSGRRAEFKRFKAFEDEAARARIPDPNALDTFIASKLRWDEREHGAHGKRLALIERLLALRAQWLGLRLANVRPGGTYAVDGDVLRVTWRFGEQTCARWQLVANFGEAPHPLPHGERVGGEAGLSRRTRRARRAAPACRPGRAPQVRGRGVSPHPNPLPEGEGEGDNWMRVLPINDHDYSTLAPGAVRARWLENESGG